MKNLLDFIPILNLYPIWAQMTVVITVLICISIVTVVLVFAPRNTPATKESKVSVEHSIKKKFEVNVSLTEFSKVKANWAPTDSLCCATFNIMNAGDLPFTIQDFFITASLDENGTKSVHRAFNENGEKLNPVIVDPDRSSVVKVYFNVRKAIFAVPDKIGKKLDLYSDIVVEAIARDGLRENLIFKGNTLQTEVVELDKNYFHKLLHAMPPYRTSAIRFLGNHAKK